MQRSLQWEFAETMNYSSTMYVYTSTVQHVHVS